MDDRARFNNLPNLKTDNEIIDAVLSGLTHCMLKECQPFILHRNTMELSTVNRIVSFMKIESLVNFKIGDYDRDAFDYSLKLLEKGDLIANSGGWIAHLEGKLTESDWLVRVLKEAIPYGFPLDRSVQGDYYKAFARAIELKLLTPEKPYHRTEKGDAVYEAGGYSEWKAEIAKEKAALLGNKSNAIHFNGPVTNPNINQDLSLRDLTQTHNATTAIPAANDHKQKASTSLMGTWVAPVITTIVATIIIGLIAYYFPGIAKILKGK